MITRRPNSMVRNHDMSAAWRHVDVVLCALVGATVVFGAAMVYSATAHHSKLSGFFEKHVLFVLIGFGVMATVAAVDYVKLRDWARLVFVGAVLGLVAVITPLGSVHKGTRAWFDIGPIQIQPVEFAKVAVIVAVASYLGTVPDRLGPKHLAVALAMFAVPMGLVMAEPDLGSNLVILVIAVGMLVVAGFPARYLVALTLIGVVGVVGILSSDSLDKYQKARLTTFVNPDQQTPEAKTAAYNTKQAQIAISSGGLSGQGYLEGQQTKGGFVPEQQTDFIFTVAGEELGFLGSATLVLLLGGIVWRVWRTAVLARDKVGSFICIGVLCMFVFHIFENVGMNLGIMPVTGIPLPFVSYGGSATISSFAAMGLVLNVHMRRFS